MGSAERSDRRHGQGEDDRRHNSFGKEDVNQKRLDLGKRDEDNEEVA